MTMQTDMNIKNTDPIVLVCAADNNYAMPLAVMLRSVVENLKVGKNLAVFIIDGGIEEQNKSGIERSVVNGNVSLTWLKPFDNSFSEINTLQHYYTKAIYYRLYIPELLPQCKKAIYLDSDLIILGNIGKLWNIEIENYAILAARDLYPSPLLSPEYVKFTSLSGLKTDKMFNSGVMVINIEKWRNESIVAKTTEYIQKYALLDQEALNIVLQDSWKEIDPRWNQTTGIYEYKSWASSPFSEEEFDQLVNNPEVIHFTSASKPWNSIDGHPAQPLFYKYLDMTDWKGWRFTQWKRLQQKVTRELKSFRK